MVFDIIYTLMGGWNWLGYDLGMLLFDLTEFLFGIDMADRLFN